MQHSDFATRNYCGENLAWYWSSRGPVDVGTRPTDDWYAEIKDYSWSAPGFGMNTGHFTQVVWKGTTKLGCGRSGDYITCRYCDVGGNMMGAFPQNVPAPVGLDEEELEDYLDLFLI